MARDTITHSDQLVISDDTKNQLVEQKKKNKSMMMGLVRVFEDGQLNTDDSEDGWLTNMTVATGREFVGQKIYNRITNSTVIGDLTNHKIDAFSIGKGGSAVDSNNNVTLLGPQVCDTGPYDPIQINTSAITGTANDGSTVNNMVKFVESTGPGGEQGSIDFQLSNDTEIQNCPSDYYTIVKNTCIIDSAEPYQLNAGESARVDEAVLHATSETDDTPKAIAHICFSPKFVELESVLKIEWFLIL